MIDISYAYISKCILNIKYRKMLLTILPSFINFHVIRVSFIIPLFYL